jgi:hypothetical protein
MRSRDVARRARGRVPGGSTRRLRHAGGGSLRMVALVAMEKWRLDGDGASEGDVADEQRRSRECDG